MTRYLGREPKSLAEELLNRIKQLQAISLNHDRMRTLAKDDEFPSVSH